MKHKYFLALFVIAAIAVVLRLYRVSAPLADWHSWRQTDTAAVARNFITFGFNPLLPRAQDLSNIPSGKDNPQGYFMTEFPLYQTIGVTLARIFPLVQIEVLLRLVTVAASFGTVLFLGLLVAQYTDDFTGLLAAFVFTILPYSIYYGRTILPDEHMVFWAILSLWFLSRGKQIGWTLLAAAAGALALLSKPMAAFLLVPVPYLLFRQSGISKSSIVRAFVYGVISLAPLMLWRWWIGHYPEGIPANAWLLNGNGIRFKGAWFYWLFDQRLGELILGLWGLIPFGIGLTKKNWFAWWWGAGSLLYLIIFATGNVQHDYYQIPIIPVVCLFVALGLKELFHKRQFILAALIVAATLGFSWYTVRGYYWINRPEIIEAGQVADNILPKNAKVIAPYNGDTTFLYQTNRQGWPIGFDIDKKIAMGATAYVTVSPTDNDLETKALAAKYTVLVRNDKFAIIDLTKLATPAAIKR